MWGFSPVAHFNGAESGDFPAFGPSGIRPSRWGIPAIVDNAFVSLNSAC
jgi:hypothetical protein